MTGRNGGAQAGATRSMATLIGGGAHFGATRPMASLISAALLLLTMVAGGGGVGGLAALGKASSPVAAVAGVASMNTVPVAAASTIAVPVVGGDRRAAAPTLGAASSQRLTAGWAPPHSEIADLPAARRLFHLRGLALAVEAAPVVIAVTIHVAHRGRAPPAGSLHNRL